MEAVCFLQSSTFSIFDLPAAAGPGTAKAARQAAASTSEPIRFIETHPSVLYPPVIQREPISLVAGALASPARTQKGGIGNAPPWAWRSEGLKDGQFFL